MKITIVTKTNIITAEMADLDTSQGQEPNPELPGKSDLPMAEMPIQNNENLTKNEEIE